MMLAEVMFIRVRRITDSIYVIAFLLQEKNLTMLIIYCVIVSFLSEANFLVKQG